MERAKISMLVKTLNFLILYNYNLLSQKFNNF